MHPSYNIKAACESSFGLNASAKPNSAASAEMLATIVEDRGSNLYSGTQLLKLFAVSSPSNKENRRNSHYFQDQDVKFAFVQSGSVKKLTMQSSKDKAEEVVAAFQGIICKKKLTAKKILKFYSTGPTAEMCCR